MFPTMKDSAGVKEELAWVVNSHHSYHDVLHIFIALFEIFCPDRKLYILTDDVEGLGKYKNIKCITYKSDNFRDQYLEAIEKIPEKYLLTFNDDYFISAPPDLLLLDEILGVLKSSNASFIRLVRGPNFGPQTIYRNCYELDISKEYFFSQTLSMWERDRLIDVFRGTRPSGIARKGNEEQFEKLANETCKHFGLKGFVYWNKEAREGNGHYGCSVVPHIVSAVIDGLWNTVEYKAELKALEELLGFNFLESRKMTSFQEFYRKFKRRIL